MKVKNQYESLTHLHEGLQDKHRRLLIRQREMNQVS
jgi:hypothetical protein